MKKLALALVCLISVAFFASCSPEGQPTISVLPGEKYIQNGATVNQGEDFTIGFTMASSIETGAELATLVVSIGDKEFETVTLEGTEYTYTKTLSLTLDEETRELPTATISATVTDAKGETATAAITINLDEALLVATPFEWNRHGSAAATGNLAELGLAWNTNEKDEVFAVITAVEGAELYEIPAENWAKVTTTTEKAALFGENGVAKPIRSYKGVSAFASHTYNDVIATLYNGEYHLVHITEGVVSTFKGTDVVIKGESK